MKKSLLIGQLMAVCLLVAASAWGQAGSNSGVIAGEVDDSSGAKVSGAKVEVASPALIEKVRDTVTGDDGLYRFVNLLPGVYTVTTTQTGFNGIKREGIEISTGFTATVNFALTPGSVEQTVTVTGESPVLDTQDSVVQKILSNTVIEQLPLGKSANQFTALTPGAVGTAVNQDVGGTKGENTQGFRIHGSAANDYAQLRDGMFYGTLVAAGNYMSSSNPTSVQEIQITTSGYSAEDYNTGGHANIIPKNGGNDLHGAFQYDFGNPHLQSSNLTTALQARGVPNASPVKTLYEIAGGVGGAIKKDKLWFFVDARHWVANANQAGNFFDTQEALTFPNNLYYNKGINAFSSNFYTDFGLRLTWQASTRNKFTANYIAERNCNCYFNISSGLVSPEAVGDDFYQPDWRVQGTWTFPASNKLLLWAGISFVVGTVDRRNTGAPVNSISVTDKSLNGNSGYIYGAQGTGEGFTAGYGTMDFFDLNENFSASYVTGPHAFKFGYTELQGRGSRFSQFSNANGLNAPYGVSYNFQCQAITDLTGVAYNPALLDAAGLPTTSYKIGTTTFAAPQIAAGTKNSLSCPVVTTGTASTQALLPVSVTQWLQPYNYLIKLESHAIFGQDQWRFKRLTLNLGLRFDWFTSGDQPQTEPALAQFGLPARNFCGAGGTATCSNVLDYKDLSPRLGAAYDVFGNGKTAIKGSFSRAVLFEALGGLTTATNPANTIVTSATRNWKDVNGDFIPNGDFTSASVNGELTGALNNPCFYFNNTTACPVGTANTLYDSNTTQGWMNRPYDYTLSAQIQQQVAKGFAVSFGYYRTWYGNFMVNRNIALAANNQPTNPAFAQTCFTNPTTSLLPSNVSGAQDCIYEIPASNATYFRKVQNEVEKASNFSCQATSNAPGCGTPSDVYNGIDIIANARFHGLYLQGGFTAGNEATNYCFRVNSPTDNTYTTTANFAGTLATSNTTGTTLTPCAVTPPWSSNVQVKLQAVYTLPWQQIRVSASEQNIPSIPFAAVDTFTDANAISGTSTSIALVKPNTLFKEGRNNQLDIRVAKDFTIKERFKIQPTFDVFNLLNAHSVLATNTSLATNQSVSTSFNNVLTLLDARLIKFGVHFEF